MQNLPFRWSSLPDSSRCNVQSVDLSTERGPFEKLYSLSIRKDPKNYPLNWILLTSKFRHESGDFDDWNMIRIQEMINNLLNNRLNHRIVRRILFFPLIRLALYFWYNDRSRRTQKIEKRKLWRRWDADQIPFFFYDCHLSRSRARRLGPLHLDFTFFLSRCLVNSENTGSLGHFYSGKWSGYTGDWAVSLISRVCACYRLHFEENSPADMTVVTVICAQSTGATIEIYS